METTNRTEELKKIIFDAYTSAENRLDALKELVSIDSEPIPETSKNYVNNHIHTTYSFSPYTPTAALYTAKKAGLKTAGIMDHDSVAGADEFIRAGEILEMPITVGCEVRVSMKGTKFENTKLNNPDQKGCTYVTLHGIPHQNIHLVDEAMKPRRELRNKRNINMVENINNLFKSEGITLDFEKDVVPISQFNNGGTITERHVLFALTQKIISKHNREETLELIEKLSGSPISEKKKKSVIEASDYFYDYDILGILKSGLIEKIYVDADEELMNVDEYIELSKKVGCVAGYSYLGDVTESPTGDKKAQKFEDEYLDELFPELKNLGFNSITYMPSRNTKEQLSTVMKMCRKFNFFQISGEDINSPRQKFICSQLEDPTYSHIRKNTYALIGHEIRSTVNTDYGMFSENKDTESKDLDKIIDLFAVYGGYKD